MSESASIPVRALREAVDTQARWLEIAALERDADRRQEALRKSEDAGRQAASIIQAADDLGRHRVAAERAGEVYAAPQPEPVLLTRIEIAAFTGAALFLLGMTVAMAISRGMADAVVFGFSCLLAFILGVVLTARSLELEEQ